MMKAPADVSTTKDVFIKRFCNSKKFYLDGTRAVNGPLMGDTLVALENIHRSGNIVIDILKEKLNIQRADVIKAKKEIPEEKDDSIRSMKAEIIAIFAEYKRRFKREPPGLKDMAHLAIIRKDVHNTRSFPTKDVLVNLNERIGQLLELTSEDVFGVSFELMDYHLIIGTAKIRNILTKCLDDIINEDFKESIRKSALAFSISLERQRQRLNYLLERRELSTALFFLDSPETLYYKFQDYSFILMALQVDLKKYKSFERMVPTIMINDNDREGVSITVSDYVHEKWLTGDSARFCFNFVTETVLLWENMNLRKQ